MGESAAGPALRRGADQCCQGPIAQSEEVCARIAEVVGSILNRSTRVNRSNYTSLKVHLPVETS